MSPTSSVSHLNHEHTGDEWTQCGLGGEAVVDYINYTQLIKEGSVMHEWILNHSGLLTLRLESYCQVDRLQLKVLERFRNGNQYSRRIILQAPSNDDRNKFEPVSFGLIVIDLSVFPEHVQMQILEEQIPFGRIMADNNVIKEVKLCGLVKASHSSCSFLDLVFPAHREADIPLQDSSSLSTTTFGRRTAFICDGVPAVHVFELLNHSVLYTKAGPRVFSEILTTD